MLILAQGLYKKEKNRKLMTSQDQLSRTKKKKKLPMEVALENRYH